MLPLKTITIWALVLFLSGSALLAWQMRAPAGGDNRQQVIERILLEHLSDQREAETRAQAEKRAAAYADHEFWTKFNTHVDALMVIRADELEHKKNVKHFQEAECSFAKMQRDPGWMSGKK